ncbi:uncharacterized protein J4E92_011005 [Alternaria infectoria]|uniref:uncharacterized protein n=1 Tax=Alternaria infectoria TaxID=45303 RepID=UPI0022205AF4|nr:uncharacterized protein J4E92_011005 [Alternaria infectoria]KAI4908001.1 hypothetical protein J4E92_011005 [Alternaria infectoria]
MQSYAHNKGNYVYVRRKRTRSVEVRRADDLHRHSLSSLSSEERILHYVGEERTRVCRCHDAGRHGERTSTVACESRHLSASIMLYLDRHGLESCSFADFRKYRASREAKWAMEGVFVEDFHYTSRNKDFVCRCSQPRKHSYQTPRHPEIVEQCAEFFCMHKDKNTVTKDQWKGVNGDEPPAYTPSVDLLSGSMTSMSVTSSSVPDSRPSSSGHTGEKSRPRASLETRIRDTAERLSSIIPGRHRSASIPAREPEMPPQVWQKGRPSVLISQHDAQATMGMFPGIQTDASVARARDMLGVTGLYTNKTYDPTSTNLSVVSGQSSVGTIKSERSPPFAYDEWYKGNPPQWVLEKDSEELLPSTFYVNGDRANSSGFDASSTHRPVAELPARRSPIELPARRSPVELPGKPAHQRHTATLKKLEGRTWDTRSELEAKAKAKRFSVRCTEAPPTERIGNDIEQIFELQVNPLREEVTLEFPQRSKGIICSTEEGVAVTQLRLLKDYVDVHAEELFRLWEGNRAEPDWFGGVVRPAVQLFQGWNPAMRSRFFSNEDAFLKLLAWAELVRLMNISCAKKRQAHDSDAHFPRLGELHRKFLKAVERYNKEKMSWDTSRSGVYEHDRIATDIVDVAMNTQVP